MDEPHRFTHLLSNAPVFARPTRPQKASALGTSVALPTHTVLDQPTRLVVIRAPPQRGHSHDLPALSTWVSDSLAPADARGVRARVPSHVASHIVLGDLLITRAQTYSLCHDEVCRHVALHCAPLAALSVRLWAALADVGDAAISAFDDATAEAEEYKLQIRSLLGRLEPSLDEARAARDAARVRAERLEAETADLRESIAIALKREALASEDARAARVRMDQMLYTFSRAPSSAADGTDDFNENATENVLTLMAELDDADDARRVTAGLVEDAGALFRRLLVTAAGGGGKADVPPRGTPVAVQTDSVNSFTAPQWVAPTELLAIPPAPPKPPAPDVPFEWRVFRSVFDFDRPIRVMTLSATRRLLLLLLLEKAAFDRIAIPAAGFRLSCVRLRCAHQLSVCSVF